MNIKSRFALILFSLCLLGSDYGSPAQFKISVDVDLVTIEVTAMKGGKLAADLKQEDFQLFEDGRKQKILSFDKVTAESVNSPLGASPIDNGVPYRGKAVLIIFDENTIQFVNIKILCDSAEKFVKDHMRPEDLFAVAAYRNSMKILQNFTGERDEVLAAIRQLPRLTGGGSMSFDDMLRSFEQINLSMARIRGPKSVLIYSESTAPVVGRVGDAYEKVLISAKKSNVTFYYAGGGLINARDLTGISGGGIIGAHMPQTSPASLLTILHNLATDSGGFVLDGFPNNLQASLNDLGQQISNYYILGFHSNNPKHDGAFRKIEVRTKAKGVTLRYRCGYQDRWPVDVLASSKQEQVLMNALATSGPAAAQLPIVFHPMYFYESTKAKVIIAARIVVGSVAFKKKGSKMAADLNVMGVAYAEDGSTAARFSEPLPVSFEKEKEPEFRKRNLSYQNYFKLPPGKYRLKLAVSDESNQLGAAEQWIEIPAFPQQGIVASSIVLAEQKSKLPDLIRNLKAQLLDESDPLIYSGEEIEPSVENRLAANSEIFAFFRIYNISGSPDQWDFVARPKLMDEKGKEISLNPISLKKFISPVADRTAVVGITIPIQGTTPGKYRLIIEIANTVSSETTTLATDLELTK